MVIATYVCVCACAFGEGYEMKSMATEIPIEVCELKFEETEIDR